MLNKNIQHYKGYTIEKTEWDIILGGSSIGHTTVFYISKPDNKDGFNQPVSFLKKNGQHFQINSFATAKRYISMLENISKQPFMGAFKRGDICKLVARYQRLSLRDTFEVIGFCHRGNLVKYNYSRHTAQLVGNDKCLYDVRVRNVRTGEENWVKNTYLKLKGAN